MKKRIYHGNVIVALASLSVFALILTVALYFLFANRFQAQLGSEVRLLAASLDAVEDTSAVFSAWSGDEDSRLTLIDTDGSVLFDSEVVSDLENHLDRPEVAAAMQDGFGIAKRQSATLDEMTYYAAQRLSDGRVLRLSGSQGSVLSVLVQAFLCLLLALPLALATAFFLSGRTARAIIKPIDALDLDHPDDNDIYEEFTPLLSRLSAQRRRIDSQLRELESRQREFALITDKMAEGLILLNARGEILTMNSSARRIFRVGNIDPTGQSYHTLNPPEVLLSAVAKAKEGETSDEWMRMGGRVFQIIASPVMENEVTQGVVMLIPDITERAEAERSRQEFSANVSHELKTPLTSILGYAELMKSGMVPESDTLHFAGQIYSAARRLLHLVEDIIHLSRLDENAPAQFEEVDLAEIAETVCERLQSQADAANITLRCTVQPVRAEAVLHMMDELLTNLTDNAIKYNRPNGSVDVSVEDAGENVRIRVQDTGIGIPEEHQEKIFERFYRVDKSHSREIGGTGLGLSIVKHIVAFHHASTQLESEVGKGTTITVILPKAQEQ